VNGIWSLWRIALRTLEGRSHHIMPLFINDDGRTLPSTARAVWDRLIDLDHTTEVVHDSMVSSDAATVFFMESLTEAEKQGKQVFSELLATHKLKQTQQRKKGRRAFDSRRKSIERIGLPQVRNHRLRELAQEEATWMKRLEEQENALPELTALILLRVTKSEESK
jgi:hypothetical protein